MTIKSNIKMLSALKLGVKTINKDHATDVINLYTERKIKNIDTARNLIIKLSSTNKLAHEKAIKDIKKQSSNTSMTGSIFPDNFIIKSNDDLKNYFITGGFNRIVTYENLSKQKNKRVNVQHSTIDATKTIKALSVAHAKKEYP